LKLPPANDNNHLPYVFIGDEAFALRKDFLKPYSEKELNHDRTHYNKRLSSARQIIENIFGILANRFRVFHTALGVSLDNAESIVMGACALHNFLRKKCPSSYCNDFLSNDDDGASSSSSEVLTPLHRGHNRHSGEEGKQVRDLFLEYFKNN
jgi:hypothetical protein